MTNFRINIVIIIIWKAIKPRRLDGLGGTNLKKKMQSSELFTVYCSIYALTFNSNKTIIFCLLFETIVILRHFFILGRVYYINQILSVTAQCAHDNR